MSAQRGRPKIDVEKRDSDKRRQVLQKGLIACYEIIDKIRKEVAELDAADAKRSAS